MALDPRLAQPSQTVNEEMQDRAIRHMRDVLRLGDVESERILQIYDQLIIPDLQAKLERRLRRARQLGGDPGPVTTRRTEQLLAAIDQTLERARRRMTDRLERDLRGVARDEAERVVGTINDVMPVAVETVLPAAAALERIVRESPMAGAPPVKWFEDLAQDVRDRVEREINIGLIEGETNDQIIRRVRRVTKQDRDKAEALVRTAAINVSNDARRETFRANSNVVKGYQWLATLDTRTCPICAARDGRFAPLEPDGPIPSGTKKLIPPQARPPAHINCRCAVVPVLKSWKELGIPARELDAGTRASMDGQVAGDLTFNQWLRRMARKGEREAIFDALGRSKGEAFLRGELSVDKFVSRDGRRVLTVDELRKRFPNAFKQMDGEA